MNKKTFAEDLVSQREVHECSCVTDNQEASGNKASSMADSKTHTTSGAGTSQTLDSPQRILTPANMVTLIRICLVPVFVTALLSPWPALLGVDVITQDIQRIIATVIFIIISATDWLDGYLARSRNEVTDFGKFIDPLADKILVASALLALIELGALPSWVVLIILAREFIVSGVRMLAATAGVVIAASYLGKFKTVFQMIAIVLFTIKDTHSEADMLFSPNEVLWIISWIVMTIALLLTIVSMLDYIAKARHVIGLSSLNRHSFEQWLQARTKTISSVFDATSSRAAAPSHETRSEVAPSSPLPSSSGTTSTLPQSDFRSSDVKSKLVGAQNADASQVSDGACHAGAGTDDRLAQAACVNGAQAIRGDDAENTTSARSDAPFVPISERMMDATLCAQELITCARTHAYTLATAESLTGGMICEYLTSVPGSSSVVKGGLVCYTPQIKQALCHVGEEFSSEDAVVSRACVEQMARGAHQRLDATLSVAVSGIAGPGGALPQKPVGFVCVGLCKNDQCCSYTVQFSGTRFDVRMSTTLLALQLLHAACQVDDIAHIAVSRTGCVSYHQHK